MSMVERWHMRPSDRENIRCHCHVKAYVYNDGNINKQLRLCIVRIVAGNSLRSSLVRGALDVSRQCHGK